LSCGEQYANGSALEMQAGFSFRVFPCTSVVKKSTATEAHGEARKEWNVALRIAELPWICGLLFLL